MARRIECLQAWLESLVCVRTRARARACAGVRVLFLKDMAWEFDAFNVNDRINMLVILIASHF